MPPAQPPQANGRRGRAIREADRRFIRVFVGAHRQILAASGGRILGRLGGHPLIILTTTGRKTGQPRSTPVIGIPDGPNWLVGGEREQSDPECNVRLLGRRVGGAILKRGHPWSCRNK
jgi:hypothetical protein